MWPNHILNLISIIFLLSFQKISLDFLIIPFKDYFNVNKFSTTWNAPIVIGKMADEDPNESES